MDGPDSPGAPETAAPPDVEARGVEFDDVLRRGFDEGAAEHGPLALRFETFARQAAALTRRRLARSGRGAAPGDVASALARAALADLYLAVACDERAPGAWETFSSRFESKIVALGVRRGASRAEAEQIARDLPGQLFAPPDDGAARTRLGTFDGSGSLVGWLAVIVERRMADRRRAAARAPASIDREPASRGAPGPVEAAIGAEAARCFADAVAAAWRSLTPREALALLLLHRDGLPQAQIARVLAVGEPRVSRIVAAASQKIRESVVRAVGAPAAEGATWDALRRAVAESLATLPGGPDPSSRG
jgi:RNA polymerase sigma factor (sigma-70 family)